MFLKSKQNNPTQISNRILQGTTIIGDISSEGDLRIDGIIEGNIDIKGKMVLGEKGVLRGTLTCSQAFISGKVIGNVQISEILNLAASAKIEGDIHTPKLITEEGATFNGKCNMGAVVRDINSALSSETEKRAKSS